MYGKTTEKLALEKKLATVSITKNTDVEPINTLLSKPASSVDAPDPTASRVPAQRRPSTSDIQEPRPRPGMPARAIQIDRYAAWAGVTFNTSTKSVAPHSATPTAPVELSPVMIETMMLRGYLNSSSHETCGCSGSAVGSWISLGSILSAQASERRASSKR